MTIPRVASWPVVATDFQFSLQGLLMGTGTPYRLLELDGLGMPAIRSSDAERAGAHGSFGGSDFASTRQLVMRLGVGPRQGLGDPDVHTLVENLNDAWSPLSDDTGLAFKIPNIGSRVLIGRPRRCEAPYDVLAAKTTGGGGYVEALVMFEALDPLKYGGLLNDQSVLYGTSGTNAGIWFGDATAPGFSFAPRRIVQNGGFESAAATDGGWLVSGGLDLNVGATLTRDTITKHSGAAAGKLVTSGAATSQGARQLTLVNLLPNTSYTFTVWFNLATAGGVLRLIVRDITNGIVVGSANMTTVGAWTQITQAITTGPTGPVQIQLAVRDDGTAVTRTFYVDDLRGDLTSAVQAYADPSTAVGAVFGPIGGGAGAAGFGTLVSAGKEQTAPVTIVRAAGGPVTGPIHIRRVESNEDIILNFNLNTNDTLELDHDLHTVLYNGVTNRSDVADVASAWWKLRPGNNTIQYRSEGPGAGSLAEVLWRDSFW